MSETRCVSCICLLLRLPLLLLLVGGCERTVPALAAPADTVAGRGLALSSVLGESATAGFARSDPGYQLRFPADHGPHPAFRSEWWYLTLMLEDAAGNEFGGQFTLFRQALEPASGPSSANPWRTNELYMAHLAVSDVTGNRHRSAERFSRAQPELAGVQALPFRAWLEDWALASTDASGALLPLTLRADAGAFAWELDLQSGKARVLQGEAGFSAKGPAQASHYYSYTRLPVTGRLRLDDRWITVSGNGWLDREWSTSVLGAGQIGWDWFALQLDDGRDIMAFRLRRADCSRDPFDHGVLVAADGTSESLDSSEFTLQPVRWWSPSDASGATTATRGQCPLEAPGWPVEWTVTVHGETFSVHAAIDDQRMQTSLPYWEGLVRIERNGQSVGRGFLELTGY